MNHVVQHATNMSQEDTATTSKRGVQDDDDLQGVVQELLVLSTSSLDLESEKKAESLLSSIATHSDDHGIDSSSLSTLISLLTRKTSLPESALIDLVGHLYPRDSLSQTDLLAIASCVGKGHQKVDQRLQDTLLQWLACLYPVLSDVEKGCLEKCYSALWLGHSRNDDCGGLRALLAQMTRKHHVTPLRLKKCLDTFGRSSLGSNNAEHGRGLLFWTMRIYCLPRFSHISGYKGHREKMWQLLDSKKLYRFRNLLKEPNGTRPMTNGDSNHDEVQHPAKRIKLSPPLLNGLRHTAPSSPVHSSQSQRPTNILDKVEQTVADDMFCKLDAGVEEQFHKYLDVQTSRLRYQVYTEDNLERILAVLVRLVKRSKDIAKPVLGFVATLLSYKRESGLEIPSPTELLGLLQLNRFLDEDGSLKNRIPANASNLTLIRLTFHWYEEFCIDGTEDSLIGLLRLYTRLLSSWSISWKTSQEERTLDSYKPFEDLHEHVSKLILRILSTFESTRCHNAVLSYFAVLADLASLAPKDHFVRVLRPESLSVYILALASPSLRSLEGQLSLLAEFKNSFEAALLVSRPEGLSHKPYDRDYVNRFNGFLMDLCNMLWRNRAFNSSDANARGCLIPDIYLNHLKQYTENLLPPQLLHGILALSFHPTLAALSVGAFQELEDEYISNAVKPLTNGSMTNGTNGVHHEHDVVRHAGPVSQRSLSTLRSEGGADISWIDYRIHVLDWLADRGAFGIREMMESTMKTAMASRKRPSDAGSA